MWPSMCSWRAGALHVETRIVVAGPAVHLGGGDLGMGLHADGRAGAEGLVGVGAGGEAEKRLLLPQRDADPLRLAANKLGLVVGAHGAAEDDGAAMVLQRLGQGIAITRLADIERVAVAAEPLADVAGVGMLLVED